MTPQMPSCARLLTLLALNFLLLLASVSAERGAVWGTVGGAVVPFSAAVLGASGQVGMPLVRRLARRKGVTRVVVLHRRHVPELASIPKVEQWIVPMGAGDTEALHAMAREKLKGIDAAFVTLGVGKASQVTAAALEHVDVELPTAFARGAKAAGVRHMALMSAVAADLEAESWFNHTHAGLGLYRRLKGTVERNFRELDFETLSITRPSTITGNKNTHGFVQWAAPYLRWLLPTKYHDIHVEEMASLILAYAETALVEGHAHRQRIHGQWVRKVKIFEGKYLFELLELSDEARHRVREEL